MSLKIKLEDVHANCQSEGTLGIKLKPRFGDNTKKDMNIPGVTWTRQGVSHPLRQKLRQRNRFHNKGR